ncbi:MAG TPA: alanine racemase [Steroidobacteraceae bacterium]|nr:alanine racemase [Steroidobacteraceae bacterium]
MRITIDLGALAANYALLVRRVGHAEVAAVVKANAYGLGIAPVASRLVEEGCRTFFVSTLAEGIELRTLQSTPRIYVLNEAPPDSPALFVRHNLLPVLNTCADAVHWAQQAAGAPAALQIDTGMTRAGVSMTEFQELAGDPTLRSKLNLLLLVSHLACADEPARSLNDTQLERFERLRRLWPGVPWSLANSAGSFLGTRFHGDVVRTGIALYGGRPFATGANPMAEVVRMEGQVLQLREVREQVSVGYGATRQLSPPARIATVDVGYADGYPRALGGCGYAVRAGQRAPLLGRVSMDLLTLDVSAPAHVELAVGDYVELIGGGVPLEEVAALAGTVNYELLTRLSRRAQRIYR